MESRRPVAGAVPSARRVDGRALNAILGLADPWAYIVVGLLALAEGAALVGLFLPGEASLLLGGVLAYQGRASLVVMLLVACGGAVAGDSIGYELGRHFGRRLQATWLGRKIGDERWAKARDYVRRRGGRAVFFGRFVGFLRSLVPPVAGDAHVPYRKFLLFNFLGGTIWATGFVLLGYAAGGSWHVVERWAGRASLVLLALFALAALIAYAARRVGSRAPEVRSRYQAFLRRPTIVRFRERYARQIAFLKRRFEPGQRFGLYLTASLVTAIAGAYIFGAVLEDVLARNEIALFDRPVVRWLAEHREPPLTTAMRVVTFFGSNLFAALALGGGAVAAFVITRSLRWSALQAIVLAGALATFTVIKPLVGRPRPSFHPLVDAGGFAFPSGHATVAAATFGALAFLLSRHRSWGVTVWIFSGALFATLLVGFSRVYLGVHWPTDVIGGWALGGFWTATSVAAVNLLWDR